MESLTSGTLAGTGSFRCEECGYVVTLAAGDALPDARAAAASSFARASLFSGGPLARAAGAAPEAEPGALRGGAAARHRAGAVPRLRGARRRTASCRSSASGRASAAASPRTSASTTRPCRAGTRSIVRQPDGVRVLDDRSLNGVFVNGERVEWRELRDGDEIVVGPLPAALPRRRRRRARRRPRRTPARLGARRPAARRAYDPPARGRRRSQSSPRRAAPARRRRCARSPTSSAAPGLRVLAVDLDPAGQPVGLLRRRPRGRADDRRRPRGPREGAAGRPRRRHPGEPLAGRGRAGPRGQDGPRADAQARSKDVEERLRRRPASTARRRSAC